MTAIATHDPRRFEALRDTAGVAATAAVAPSRGPAMKTLPPAPPSFRERPAMDLEGLCHLMKRTIDSSLDAAKGETSSKLKLRAEKAHAQTQKAEEARSAASERGFWDKVASAFSWIAEVIGVTIAIASAVVTGGALAIVIASAAVLSSVLEHSNAYKEMGDFGKVLGGCLKTVSAAGNVGSLSLTAVSQTLEKSGLLAEIAKQSTGVAIALQASLGIGSAACGAFWSGGALVKPPSFSDLQRVATRVLTILKGTALVGAGTGQVMGAVSQHDVDKAGIATKQLRIEADKLRKGIQELMETMTEEVERRGRVLGLAVEIQEGKHTVAMALAASVKA